MNQTLQQLIQALPAVIASAKGNPQALSAFMDGYQRTQREMQQREQLQQQAARQQQMDVRQQRLDTLSLEDRQREIARQAEADRVATEQRSRQYAMQGLQIPGTLAELGSTAETPEGAGSLIDAALAQLQGAFPQARTFRDPALGMATQTITGRQKKQVEAFLEKALKVAHIADNPEADPEIVDLPEHIQKVIGKPSAKLSELQTFADLPVGKPARPPSADPSLQSKEVLVNGKPTIVTFNPKTGEHRDQSGQIVQVSPIPPKEPTMTGQADVTDTAQQLVDGNLLPSMLSRRGNYNQILSEANRLSKAQTGKPYNAARAQTEFAAAQRFVGAMNSQQQQRFRALAGSVVNTIDEVRILADELKNSGVPLVNKVKLAAYINAAGNSEMGQKASQYMAAVNTLKEEFANLAQGGYAPTEAAWALANSQINGNYGVQQLNASLTEVQRLINFRMQAFEALTPYGVTPGNPATSGLGSSTPSNRLYYDANGNPIKKP